MRGKTIAKLVVASLLLLPLAYCSLWPLLGSNRIDRFTIVNGWPKSLIPAIFPAGAPRAFVHYELAAAGYNHNGLSPHDQTYADPCGDYDSLCQRLEEGYTDIFGKPGIPTLPMSLICTSGFIIWVQFDPSGFLQKARNEIYYTCL